MADVPELAIHVKGQEIALPYLRLRLDNARLQKAHERTLRHLRRASAYAKALEAEVTALRALISQALQEGDSIFLIDAHKIETAVRQKKPRQTVTV